MSTASSASSESDGDWQTTRETVRERTAFLFNKSLMNDIKFVVTDSTQFGSRNGSHIAESDCGAVGDLDDDDDKRYEEVSDSQVELDNSNDSDVQVRVPAHKLVLAIGSPVFQAMFYGDMSEKGNEIELPDTESEYLLEFLRFLYCDEANVTANNVFGILYLANKYIVPCLAAKCWSFIDKDPSVCLKSTRAVSTLDHGTLVSLLKRDSLCSKEFALFDALKRWAEAKCRANDSEPNGKTVREIIGEAVNLIRFPTMSLKDFAGKVVGSGILTSDEALQVHQYFAGEIAAEGIGFSSAYRAGLLSTAQLHEYCAYDEKVSLLKTSWRDKVQGKLSIAVESKNIHLSGVCLLTSLEEDEKIDATVQLKDENGHELATQTGRFLTKELSSRLFQDENKFCGFDVKFTIPVLLWRSSTYTIIYTTVFPRSYRVGTSYSSYQINRDPSRSVQFYDDVYFKFRGISRHIFKLLLYKLD